MEILNSYVKSAPSIANAVNIFQGEWAAQLPGDLAPLTGGKFKMFQDKRIPWAVEQLGGIEGKRVLEIGPLEAGHTYQLEKFGAREIIAVEANTRAYLKCLIVKEILGLERSRFLCGDCGEYLRENQQERFDVIFASGILYHLLHPVEFIGLLAGVTDAVFIWTHYYDREVVANNANIVDKFGVVEEAEYGGFRHKLYRYGYQAALDAAGFCGGSNSFSYWMRREDILGALAHFGLTEMVINFEQPEHPHGPCFAVMARRRNRLGHENH